MKKVIPPFLFLICVAMMIVIRLFADDRELIPSPFNLFDIVLILSGLMLAVHVQKMFTRYATEIHTFKRPRNLVTSGVFRFSRNPIYLGFVTSLVGVWVLSGTSLPFIGCIVFFAAAHYWYIPCEERALKERFGTAYHKYCSAVRRWI